MSNQLQRLKGLLASARETVHLDLPIPRVSPAIIVRFKPVEQSRAEKLTKDAAKDKREDATVRMHARLLAEQCLGIWMLDDAGAAIDVTTGDPVDPDTQKLPTFDSSELITTLDVTSREGCVRAFYMTDGDIMAASLRVQEWSGEVAEDIAAAEDDALSG